MHSTDTSKSKERTKRYLCKNSVMYIGSGKEHTVAARQESKL